MPVEGWPSILDVGTKFNSVSIAQVKLFVNITHGITLGRDLGRGLG